MGTTYFYVLLPYIIYVMQLGRFSQSPAFLSRTAKEWDEKYSVITINVPLFKKLRDIIFFWGENHFMSHFEGHF
jgi:hypothetical protein